WSACQKAPSVTVTWGWGNHDLLADLGNNASYSSSRFLCRKPCKIFRHRPTPHSRHTSLILQNLLVECILHRVQNGMVHYANITPAPAPRGGISPAAATQHHCNPL
ncbi:hypothetical protein ACW5WG_21505, partial [Aeromonas salmonicida]